MTQAHTKGPWMYNATAGNHDYAVYPEATGRDVALVRDFHEGNARLIAKAPELLEIVKLFAGALATNYTHHAMNYEFGDRTRTLLAEIEGSHATTT